RPRLHRPRRPHLRQMAPRPDHARLPPLRPRRSGDHPDAGSDPDPGGIHPDDPLRADDRRAGRVHRLVAAAAGAGVALREEAVETARRRGRLLGYTTWAFSPGGSMRSLSRFALILFLLAGVPATRVSASDLEEMVVRMAKIGSCSSP